MRYFKAFFLFILYLMYSVSGYSQTTEISISRPEMKISALLSLIETQTKFLFVYNKNSVNVERRVQVKTGKMPVYKALDQAFQGTDVNYVVEGHNIILRSRPENTENKPYKIRITGRVTDEKGQPIIGVNILQKGTNQGTISNIDGSFSLSAFPESTLIISCIGYEAITLALNGRKMINVSMKENIQELEAVVITAMGLEKTASSLTYSTQQINGNELSRVKEPNFIHALAGKTAGVQINKTSNLGGSAKVSIRGARSAFAGGNNQPLYVIDGIPMLNTTTESTATVIGGDNDGLNRDAGDGISNLNPDDIESINILRGASAAALYGSQAANGVILITTKKGRAGIQRITFSSGLTIDQAISTPEFQNSYGQNEDGGIASWGSKGAIEEYHNLDHYFSNGVTAIHSLSVTTGNEKIQTYFSYANTTAKGIVSNNKLQKHNLNLREIIGFFDNRLRLDGSVTLMMQKIKNSPATGGYYLNPLVSLYSFPRGVDLSPYQKNYEVLDADRNLMSQNWIETNEDGTISEWGQNPYWLRNRVLSNNKRYRALASLSLNLKLTDDMTLQGRGNIDYANDKFDNKMYATTAPNITGKYEGKENGRYAWWDNQEFQMYADIMLLYYKNRENYSLSAALGSSINLTQLNALNLDSKTASLYKPNVFTVPNMVISSKAAINQTIDQRRTLQSVFATAQFGWKDQIYVDLTARNDWSSTLAYTASKNSGFFYPSAGLSWLIHKTFHLPEWINFAKIRGSWAEVGNDLPIGITNPTDIITAGGGINVNTVEQRGDLKPEISRSIEFGTKWRFFHDRFGVDFTWYRTHTKNQLLRMNNPAGSAYKYRYINAGKIRNQGFELTVDATPLMSHDFRWKTVFNMSGNDNKVISLHPDYTEFSYYGEGFNAGYQMRIKAGGKLGDIYGNAFQRDEYGKIIIDDSTGKPLGNTGNKDLLGNANPDFLLGWANTFSYKNISLYFLTDFRFGGDVMSLTQSELDARGVTKVTGEARDRGYVIYQGEKFDNPRAFYSAVGGRNAISEYYMYDATHIRLREVSLSYTFPKAMLEKSKFIKGLDFSLVARNLCFLKKEAPFDPDAVLSVGNNNQGVDVFGMPTTRNIGINLKFTF